MSNSIEPTDSNDTPTHRSEIVVLYDVVDANPNGDPRRNNQPRQDPYTNHGMSTDVRLKRYIRDQLAAEDYTIFVREPRRDEESGTRTALFKSIVEEDDPEAVDSSTWERFIDRAIDVRMFGATFSFSREDALGKAFAAATPSNLQGPVQFQHGTTFHPIALNEDTRNLTTVIRREEESETGTFATDHRVKYGLYGYQGIINEQAAAETELTNADIDLLDRVTWRSLVNQPLSRSKLGHTPRLYLRVEYNTKWFHIGRLARTFRLETSDQEMLSVRDLSETRIIIDDFVKKIEKHAEKIGAIHMIVHEDVPFSLDGEALDANEFSAEIDDRAGGDKVVCVEPFEEETA